jgi:Nickel responsive protein SCO4226-like
MAQRLLAIIVQPGLLPIFSGKEKFIMPRYMVERTFVDGLAIPVNEKGVETCLIIAGNNAKDNVTWLHSYVTDDRRKSFCIYDGPSPEAIQAAAERNGLPVDRITEVRVLDPYFYR